jgi:hypothetical protein
MDRRPAAIVRSTPGPHGERTGSHRVARLSVSALGSRFVPFMSARAPPEWEVRACEASPSSTSRQR